MILTLIEQENGAIAEGTLQMLTFARETAARLGEDVAALLFGETARPLIAEVGKYGAATAALAIHEALDEYGPAAYAASAIQAMELLGPTIVMAAASDRGSEVMAHVAARTDAPLAANCSAVTGGDPFKITRLRWGSSLLEEAVIDGDPRLLTVALHTVEAQEAPEPVEPVLQTIEPTLTEMDLRVRVSRREEIVEEGITLKTAPVVVGGGRGVGGPEGYAILEELAGLLGGAVGGSRVATNNGWRPHSDQVGLTGTRISPELYIACGISGAIQHLVGCKGAKNILVINKDPEAAFFAKADYGVLGDLHEVVPALTEAIRAEKG
jgi:electron transfer flavoprotein alpha subunit